MEVPVREMKNNLSKYLKLVQAGEDIVITSRGRPMARLIAPAGDIETAVTSREELLKRLKSIPGVVVGAGGKLKGASRPIRIPPGEKSLAEIVLEDRE